jgi:hypothetical protein
MLGGNSLRLRNYHGVFQTRALFKADQQNRREIDAEIGRHQLLLWGRGIGLRRAIGDGDARILLDTPRRL